MLGGRGKAHMQDTLVPILRVSGNTIGSHSTVYPNGTRAESLVHYDGSNEPANHVTVEMVTIEHANEVRRRGSISFSSESEMLDWMDE